MIRIRLIRAELRKLTTTKMPLVFLTVVAVISAINAIAVVWGTDFDGTKTFISTAADQQSLIAFASNATLIAGLFGAIAVAREYGHGTVIPTFLSSPRRYQAVIAQLIAVAIGGAVVGLVGATLTTVAVALALPTTDFGFMVPAADVVRVLAAASFAGAAGAVLGAGIGAIVRNTGGAVTGAVLMLIIAPPLIAAADQRRQYLGALGVGRGLVRRRTRGRRGGESGRLAGGHARACRMGSRPGRDRTPGGPTTRRGLVQF